MNSFVGEENDLVDVPHLADVTSLLINSAHDSKRLRCGTS